MSFDNEKRQRYYGIRIGDIVCYRAGINNKICLVTDYGIMDNNRVQVRPIIRTSNKSIELGSSHSVVAEACKIIIEVEDIN